MISDRWKNFEVPDLEGVVTSSGQTFEFRDGVLIGTEQGLGWRRWLDVSVLASLEILGGRYRVSCGEASAHGSIGVIVLEDMQLDVPAWVMVSSLSNPFDQIVLKGGFVLVLSSSGAVFRFRPELESVVFCV